MAEFVRIPNRADGPSNSASSGGKSKLSLVASIPKTYTEKALKRVASMDHNIFNMETALDIGWFLLKMTALDLIRRFSNSHFPIAWQSLQALQLLSYPPFKWLQKWSPFKFLVQCMQDLSKPLLVLSIATALPDQSSFTEDTSSSSSRDHQERRDSQADTPAEPDRPGPDSRSIVDVRRRAASEKWISKLLVELEKEGLTLPQRINEEELRQFYDAANGDFALFISSVKKTIRWRQKFRFLSVEELEDWSDMVYWHGRDRWQRPCLIIRLGLVCSNKTPDHRSRFSDVVVSQVEHGVLNLVDRATAQITVLMDCEGLTPLRFPMQMMRSCTILLQDHYPTRLAALFVVRLPPVARVIAHTLFQVLRPGTRQKLRIEGDNYKQALSEVLGTLPSFLGGDCSCAICEGIPVDEVAELMGESSSTDSARMEDVPFVDMLDPQQIIDDEREMSRGRILKLVIVSLLMALCILLTLRNNSSSQVSTTTTTITT